mmetsp:Transcript_79791/g.258498  ORF Transcript_79791/g.258498 Transcript_79791/m.258498 type:complete len:208 (+) Transcript_79791:1421-2044(+)
MPHQRRCRGQRCQALRARPVGAARDRRRCGGSSGSSGSAGHRHDGAPRGVRGALPTAPGGGRGAFRDHSMPTRRADDRNLTLAFPWICAAGTRQCRRISVPHRALSAGSQAGPHRRGLRCNCGSHGLLRAGPELGGRRSRPAVHRCWPAPSGVRRAIAQPPLGGSMGAARGGGGGGGAGIREGAWAGKAVPTLPPRRSHQLWAAGRC